MLLQAESVLPGQAHQRFLPGTLHAAQYAASITFCRGSRQPLVCSASLMWSRAVTCPPCRRSAELPARGQTLSAWLLPEPKTAEEAGRCTVPSAFSRAVSASTSSPTRAPAVTQAVLERHEPHMCQDNTLDAILLSVAESMKLARSCSCILRQ